MTALLLVGDVHERMTQLEDHSFDLIITSPPFLALRSYLPDDHPDKAKEIGSEATPADYLDVLLALTAEWRRLLAPHGSLAVELGDTYAGSGGAGGDYGEAGAREGQQRFNGSASKNRRVHDPDTGPPIRAFPAGGFRQGGGEGWPLEQSLCGIPHAYALSLTYGWNVLRRNPQDSPAGKWMVRNYKSWIRSNPPVGALGRKERPATSYITVACTSTRRFFDLDAVRTASLPHTQKYNGGTRPAYGERGGQGTIKEVAQGAESNPGGAPPLDWVHDIDLNIDHTLHNPQAIDALIQHELDQRAGKIQIGGMGRKGSDHYPGGGGDTNGGNHNGPGAASVGARGWHIRRRLQAAGYLPPDPDTYDISPRGYSGAHYAVWPPELVQQLVNEMCPRKVCTVCGQPSRRLTEASYESTQLGAGDNAESKASADYAGQQRNQNAQGMTHGRATKNVTTLGWSDCGHNTWRPGRILDPFSGSGTTLAVATGMGRDATGIDLDPRNAVLTEQRVGMFLTIDWGHYGPTDELPPPEIVTQVGEAL